MVQAWGLSHDSNGLLYMTDGTNMIHVIDASTWQAVKQIQVVSEKGGTPVNNLNEIEVVADKWIFANQYTENDLI